MFVVAEESNYSEYQSVQQQYGVKVRPIVVGRSEGEEWELCLLSVEELLNLEPFVCLFVLVNSSTTLWRSFILA